MFLKCPRYREETKSNGKKQDLKTTTDDEDMFAESPESPEIICPFETQNMVILNHKEENIDQNHQKILSKFYEERFFF